MTTFEPIQLRMDGHPLADIIQQFATTSTAPEHPAAYPSGLRDLANEGLLIFGGIVVAMVVAVRIAKRNDPN